MIIAKNSYWDIGALTVPLRKGRHRSTLYHLDLTTGATSRTPDRSFPTVSVISFKPGTVLAVIALTPTKSTSLPTSVPANIGQNKLGHSNVQVMAMVTNIAECGVRFLNTFSACDTCQINILSFPANVINWGVLTFEDR